MFPNPWGTSVPPPAVTKPVVNSFENNTQTYPFYATPNAMQNMSMNQQNATSVATRSHQPNAIDPAMVQKWQEWKQWELWQQQFQQWQQQTGQITAASTQPAPPPMPPSQPLQTLPPPAMPFQSQQYPYNRPGPPLPPTNQSQQINTKNEIGMKRGLEPEFQNDEKKLKIDTANNKKEIELNDDTEALFEEQFKSWEDQFFKWKEQNKNHPDKAQYLEYEKKWLNWRDHLKQKCELLKKKRELKMAEKKKETVQVGENKLQSQQRSVFGSMVSNATSEPSSALQHLHNNSVIQSTSENQIPGLDLVSKNENVTKGFPMYQENVSRIVPNQNGPIQTPDDKPFNFPKSITNPTTINPSPVNKPLSSVNQPPTSLYQNPSSWSKYNTPVPYYNQKPPDIENASVSRFSQQTDVSSRPSYSGNTSNTTYNSSQNVPNNMNYRRPLDGPYNKPPSETSINYNNTLDEQPYNRNLNTSSSNFHGYNQPSTSNSSFNRPPEKSNIPYQHSNSSSNTTPSRLPSLLSLNLVKPVTLDNPGNYTENKNEAPNRYERNWNIADEEDDPENEYMEAHKKFSSEPFDDQNDEDQFSDTQHRNVYNENHYPRGQQDYSRPLNQSRGPHMMRNTDSEYHRPDSQFSRNINQSYPRDIQTLKSKEDDYYKPQNNIRSMDQRFPRGAPLPKDIDEYSDEPVIDKNNFVSKKLNYGPPSRGNHESSRGNYDSSRGDYDSSRGNFGNNTNRLNVEWDKDYVKNEGPQPLVKDIIAPPPIVKLPQVPPVDPVKIFDYRHLPTLKVIPGLTNETVIPIKIYDYKHGGKRILPWQDRGFSRRNSNPARDLNEKEVSIVSVQENNDLEKNIQTLTEEPTFNLNDISFEVKDTNVVKNEVDKILGEEISNTIDNNTITISDEEVEEQEEPQLDIEISDLRVPSPPKMLKIKETVKSYDRQLLTIETLLCPPGRLNRPSKIVIILRGLPGSGKSHVAKLIKEKEVAMGGQAPRILSLDDYFMTEVTKTEFDPETNKKVERKVMEYEHDAANESLYRTSFIKAFKKKILENYFSFYIIDAINNKVSYYKDIIDISRINGFTVYIIELESDVDLCIKRNIHNRTAHDINRIMRSWVKTPDDQILLDIRSLLHSPSQSEVEMEDVSDVEMELDKDEGAIDDSKSEEEKNVDFEEEKKIIEKYLGPSAFRTCRWAKNVVLIDLKYVSGTSY